MSENSQFIQFLEETGSQSVVLFQVCEPGRGQLDSIHDSNRTGFLLLCTDEEGIVWG